MVASPGAYAHTEHNQMGKSDSLAFLQRVANSDKLLGI